MPGSEKNQKDQQEGKSEEETEVTDEEKKSFEQGNKDQIISRADLPLEFTGEASIQDLFSQDFLIPCQRV